MNVRSPATDGSATATGVDVDVEVVVGAGATAEGVVILVVRVGATMILLVELLIDGSSKKIPADLVVDAASVLIVDVDDSVVDTGDPSSQT